MEFYYRQNRDSIVLATKCRFGSNKEDPNGTGLSRKTILKSVEDSLKRLQTEYIDLYQVQDYSKQSKNSLTFPMCYKTICKQRSHSIKRNIQKSSYQASNTQFQLSEPSL